MPWRGRKAYRKPIATSAPEFQIRRAQAQDAPACARLQVTDPDAPPLDDRAGAMVRSLQRADRWLWVASRGSEIVGFGRLAGLAPADPGSGPPAGLYLSGVSVSPAHRRRGIGRALTETRLGYAFGEQHADRVWYFTNANNAASIALHREFGFVEVQRPMRSAPVSFAGGVGVLFTLSGEAWTAETERA
ncbi:MAG TPA: N-acetyltransferase [Solirubrobacteraceae bacterium]